MTTAEEVLKKVARVRKVKHETFKTPKQADCSVVKASKPGTGIRAATAMMGGWSLVEAMEREQYWKQYVYSKDGWYVRVAGNPNRNESTFMLFKTEGDYLAWKHQ